MSLRGDPVPPPAAGPAGRERTPPATPASSKQMTARVLLLDDSLVPFHIQVSVLSALSGERGGEGTEPTLYEVASNAATRRG